MNPIFQNIPSLVVVLLAGLTTNFIRCIILNVKNKFYITYYTDQKTPIRVNYLFCMIAGVTWCLQFFFYGRGSSKMGKYDFSSWTFHMAFIIIVSTLWGIYFKEWKGSGKNTMQVIKLGIFTDILSTIAVGLRNYVASYYKINEHFLWCFSAR